MKNEEKVTKWRLVVMFVRSYGNQTRTIARHKKFRFFGRAKIYLAEKWPIILVRRLIIVKLILLAFYIYLL